MFVLRDRIVEPMFCHHPDTLVSTYALFLDLNLALIPSIFVISRPKLPLESIMRYYVVIIPKFLMN